MRGVDGMCTWIAGGVERLEHDGSHVLRVFAGDLRYDEQRRQLRDMVVVPGGHLRERPRHSVE